jgi:hypothetical protein
MLILSTKPHVFVKLITRFYINSLGTIYYFQQRYDSAIYFFNKSMTVKLEEYADLMMVKTNLKNLIEAYKLNKQDSKSKELEVALRNLENL